MKTGIVGLGAIAPYFLDALAADDGFDLVAVCDRDEVKLEPYADGPVHTFTHYADLLESGQVEAVIITLPNDLHAEVAGAALAAGLHVCCEKPLTIDPADAYRLADAARAVDRVLLTAFHRRYNRHVQALAEQVAGARSPVVAVRAHYDENIIEHTGGDRWYLDPARCGGGCVIDNGPNALDAVRSVVGPLTVQDARIGNIRSGVEFCAELRLRTVAGAPVEVSLDWALTSGQRKDIEVHLATGQVLAADMLAGFPGLKSSLAHEYTSILAAFRAAIESPRPHVDEGPAIVDLVADAYRIARRAEPRLRMASKAELTARLVKLMYHSRDERGMSLSPWSSRAVLAGDVHELVTTSDRPERTGDHVDNVGFLGFATFGAAGMVERGDVVRIGGRRIGSVLGFDECHAPNHLNILIAADRPITAGDLDLAIDDEVTFTEER